jgi:hypothetical protein
MRADESRPTGDENRLQHLIRVPRLKNLKHLLLPLAAASEDLSDPYDGRPGR